MQPESKCLFIKGVTFDYHEVCIESCYWCHKSALQILVALIILIAINSLMR